MEIDFVNNIIEKKKQGYIRVRQILVRSEELAVKLKRELDRASKAPPLQYENEVNCH